MTAPALPRPAQLRRARRRKQAAFRWVVVGLLMIFFLAPFVALLDFSTRRRDGSREWTAWEPIGQVFSGGSLEGDTIRVGSAVDDDHVDLWVHDTGPGIARADRERVMERFVRAGTSRAEGSGLGLAIVGGIARAHGGEVVVDDTAVGARVRLQLPVGG